MNDNKTTSPFKSRGKKGYIVLTKSNLKRLIKQMPTDCEFFNFELRQSKRNKDYYYMDIEVKNE